MARDDLDNEQRLARRQRVLKQGKILTLNHKSVVDCVVRDFSEKGAKIRCEHQAAVPDEFRLVMTAENLMREAKVKWRRGDDIGVNFVGEARRAPPLKW